jgi:hypothetical protein
LPRGKIFVRQKMDCVFWGLLYNKEPGNYRGGSLYAEKNGY